MLEREPDTDIALADRCEELRDAREAQGARGALELLVIRFREPAPLHFALENLGAPIYVRKEIVHNRHVVSELAEQGAVFVDDLADVPSGAVLVFSAHGVSPAVRSEAIARNLRVIDATCPLVTKVHLEAVRYVRDGYMVILIGHRDHDEVVGTLGEAPGAIQLISSVEEADTVVAPGTVKVARFGAISLNCKSRPPRGEFRSAAGISTAAIVQQTA